MFTNMTVADAMLSTKLVTTTTTRHRCELNDVFGLALQAILAFTAFCVLILKRLREPLKERRPLKIWMYDTSKQAFGAILIHFSNVYLSSEFNGDPCTWYFINFLLDTTVGLSIIWFFIKIITLFAKLSGIKSLRFGEYGIPPQRSRWLIQCTVYMFLMMFEKGIIILMLVKLPFWEHVRKTILLPVRNYPRLEVAIVMLIVPFLLNALMFWVIDNFLMVHKIKTVIGRENEGAVKYVRLDPETGHGSDGGIEVYERLIGGQEYHNENAHHRHPSGSS